MSTECSEDDLPLVTIITPTYNSNPQYLKEAIESVLEQTYPKIEYIITDDGSSVFHEDLIEEIISHKNQGNITWKIIKNSVNIGTVKNLNQALQISHGEFIFYLAHDDVYYNSSVISERVTHFLSTGCLLSMCLAEYASLDFQELFGVFPSEKEIFSIKTTSPIILASRIAIRNPFIGATFAFSKKYFDIYGFYDEKYRVVEDAHLVYRCLTNNIPIDIHELIGIRYRIDRSDKNKRYFINPTYNADCITLRKEQFQSAIGMWKILMYVDLKRLTIKQTLLLNNKRKLLILLNKFEDLFRHLLT